MAKYYVHSAIPYVNAAPHIGHAQEFVLSDVVRRYQKLLGNDVLYLSGADENGLKIIQAAEKSGLDPQKFCDIHQQEFLGLAEKLNVHFDIWQRGTSKKHTLSSQKLWELCLNNGDIYKKKYEGLYCVGCEVFYTTEELNVQGECFEHPGKKLETISEENYFFRLSKYQSYLDDLIDSDKLKITPIIRKNEALAFIRKGLEDFSISRSKTRAKNWGVPVPGDPEQIMYVWFDALNIYQSGIGFGWDDKLYDSWWPPKLQIIGKGILRFHVIYWPAILASTGLLMPKETFVHGYITVNGQKMSKTIGNVVDPIQTIEKYGVDALRYYLLREIPSTNDGDFSERRFREIYNADLANGLGNLVARVAKLAEHSSFIIQHSTFNLFNTEVYKQALEEYRFHDALAYIWEKIKIVDKYIDTNEPWKLSGENLQNVLEQAIAQIIEIATLLQPFLPGTSEKILKQFAGPMITPQGSLFPRII